MAGVLNKIKIFLGGGFSRRRRVGNVVAGLTGSPDHSRRCHSAWIGPSTDEGFGGMGQAMA